MAPSSGCFLVTYIPVFVVFFIVIVNGSELPDGRSSLIGVRYFYAPSYHNPITPHFIASKLPVKNSPAKKRQYDPFATVMVYSGDGDQSDVLTDTYISPTVPSLHPTPMIAVPVDDVTSTSVVPIISEYPDSLSDEDDSILSEEDSHLRRSSLHYLGPSSTLVLEPLSKRLIDTFLPEAFFISSKSQPFLSFESSIESYLQFEITSHPNHDHSQIYLESSYMDIIDYRKFDIEGRTTSDDSNIVTRVIVSKPLHDHSSSMVFIGNSFSPIMTSAIIFDDHQLTDQSSLKDQHHFSSIKFLFSSTVSEIYSPTLSFTSDQAFIHDMYSHTGPFFTQSFMTDHELSVTFTSHLPTLSSFSSVDLPLASHLKDIPIGMKTPTMDLWMTLSPMVTITTLISQDSDESLSTKRVPKILSQMFTEIEGGIFSETPLVAAISSSYDDSYVLNDSIHTLIESHVSVEDISHYLEIIQPTDHSISDYYERTYLPSSGIKKPDHYSTIDLSSRMYNFSSESWLFDIGTKKISPSATYVSKIPFSIPASLLNYSLLFATEYQTVNTSLQTATFQDQSHVVSDISGQEMIIDFLIPTLNEESSTLDDKSSNLFEETSSGLYLDEYTTFSPVWDDLFSHLTEFSAELNVNSSLISSTSDNFLLSSLGINSSLINESFPHTKFSFDFKTDFSMISFSMSDVSSLLNDSQIDIISTGTLAESIWLQPIMTQVITVIESFSFLPPISSEYLGFLSPISFIETISDAQLSLVDANISSVIPLLTPTYEIDMVHSEIIDTTDESSIRFETSSILFTEILLRPTFEGSFYTPAILIENTTVTPYITDSIIKVPESSSAFVSHVKDFHSESVMTEIIPTSLIISEQILPTTSLVYRENSTIMPHFITATISIYPEISSTFVSHEESSLLSIMYDPTPSASFSDSSFIIPEKSFSITPFTMFESSTENIYFSSDAVPQKFSTIVSIFKEFSTKSLIPDSSVLQFSETLFVSRSVSESFSVSTISIFMESSTSSLLNATQEIFDSASTDITVTSDIITMFEISITKTIPSSTISNLIPSLPVSTIPSTSIYTIVTTDVSEVSTNESIITSETPLTSDTEIYVELNTTLVPTISAATFPLVSSETSSASTISTLDTTSLPISVTTEMTMDIANVTMIIFIVKDVNESGINRRFWIKTVIKARPEDVNISIPYFKDYMESRLALAYLDLLKRKKQAMLGLYEPLRRRRAIRADNVTVQMIFFNRTEGSNKINLVYAVAVDGSWIPAQSAEADMNELMDIQEMALWMGHVVANKAEEYDKFQQAFISDQQPSPQYWIIGLVLGILILLLFILLCIFLTYNKIFRHKKSQHTQPDSLVSHSPSKDFDIGRLDLTYAEDVEQQKLETSSFRGSTFQRPERTKPPHQVLDEVLSRSDEVPAKPPRGSEQVERETSEGPSEETDESVGDVVVQETKHLHKKPSKSHRTSSKSRHKREAHRVPTVSQQTDEDSDAAYPDEMFGHVHHGSTPFERGWQVRPPLDILPTALLPRVSTRSSQTKRQAVPETPLEGNRIPRAHLPMQPSIDRTFEMFPQQQFIGSPSPEFGHLESDDSDRHVQLESERQRAQDLLDNAFLLTKLPRGEVPKFESMPTDQPVAIWTTETETDPSSSHSTIRVPSGSRHKPIFIQGPSSAPTSFLWSPYQAGDETARIAATMTKKPPGGISAPNIMEAPPPYSQHRTKPSNFPDIHVTSQKLQPTHFSSFHQPPDYITSQHEANGQPLLMKQGRTLSSPDILPPYPGYQIPRADVSTGKQQYVRQIPRASLQSSASQRKRPKSHPEDADEMDIARAAQASNERFKPVVRAIKEELIRMKMDPEWSQGARF